MSVCTVREALDTAARVGDWSRGLRNTVSRVPLGSNYTTRIDEVLAALSGVPIKGDDAFWTMLIDTALVLLDVLDPPPTPDYSTRSQAYAHVCAHRLAGPGSSRDVLGLLFSAIDPPAEWPDVTRARFRDRCVLITLVAAARYRT